MPNALLVPHAVVDIRALARHGKGKTSVGSDKTGQQKYQVFKKLMRGMMQILWLLALGWFYEPQGTEDSFANLISPDSPSKSILFCAF